jgi:hypothetical protein
MRLLAERYLASFPHARSAVCGVEAFFLSESVDTRLRYLTRQEPLERWRYAMRAPALEERLALLAGMGLPIVDFAVPLHEALTRHPGLTLQRLLWDRPAIPGTDSAALRGWSYPWGSPPVMDAWAVPDAAAPAFLRTRSYLLVKNSARIPDGLADLKDLVACLRGRGLTVTFTGMPYSAPLVKTLEREYPAYERSRRLLADYAAASGRSLGSEPAAWDRACFTDADHMTPLGASRLAEALAARWDR